MFELLVLGTLWFWLVLAGASIAIIAFAESGYGRGATGTALFAGGFLVAANGWWVPLKDHPWYALAGLGVYLTAGVVYAVIKWWSYVRDRRAALDQQIKETLDGEPSIEAWVTRRDSLLPHKTYTVNDFWGIVEHRQPGSVRVSRHVPLASEHKARIMTWMSYWPWSAAWTLVNDPVRRMFRAIYHEIAGQLQRIADRAWKGVPQ